MNDVKKKLLFVDQLTRKTIVCRLVERGGGGVLANDKQCKTSKTLFSFKQQKEEMTKIEL